MIKVRKSNDRGHANNGWLDTYHTFSFNTYMDRNFMGYRSLRVINEDRVEAGKGFGTHPHNDMEIITYVLEGALAHKDSLGTGSTIRPGDVQRMSAGRGILHSEMNPSETEPVHLLQIWLFPSENGLKPSYEQTHFPREEKLNKLRLVASQDGSDGSVTIHQDAKLFASVLEEGETVSHSLDSGRGAWVQVTRGEVKLGDETLVAGDGASVEELTELTLAGVTEAELLLFDLA